jgi:malate synthase
MATGWTGTDSVAHRPIENDHERGRMMDRTTTTPRPPEGVTIHGPWQDRYEEILTHDALEFLAQLHREFEPRRQRLLKARRERQKQWDQGGLPGFLEETRSIREDASWRIGPLPEGLLDRRVEITGPVDRKMMINAFNSGAKVFMADFEDSNSPTWSNNIDGQLNLLDFTNDRLHHKDPRKGKEYQIGDDPATLIVRVRGLHLDEAHLRIDGEPVSAALFDFALHYWHNAKRLIKKGLGPWYYIPKLEHHEEAALWNDVFKASEQGLGLEGGTIKATCLIETFPAVFQMEEIIYQLKDHMAGLNAGRWDYIFSCIKVCKEHEDKILPDRAQVTMTVPFMRAYTELLVATCHKRGAFAMGGMSAFIPNRRDQEVTKKALQEVRADKKRETHDGFDGTWVAHPDLVEVAKEIFDEALGGRVNQLEVDRDDVQVAAQDLQDFRIDGAQVTQAGLKNNIEVALTYLESWLRGTGAVAINNLMEDAATAEISRSQIWQWIRHKVVIESGTPVTKDLVSGLIEKLAARKAADAGSGHRYQMAAVLLRDVALGDDCPEFLTLPAYEILVKETRS